MTESKKDILSMASNVSSCEKDEKYLQIDEKDKKRIIRNALIYHKMLPRHWASWKSPHQTISSALRHHLPNNK
jgi:hypothetical protein